MNANSCQGNPDRYILLIADSVFHYNDDGTTYSILTENGVATELTNSGASVYMSLWDPDDVNQLYDLYSDLLVNTGEFDAANDYSGVPSVPMAGKYPLANLRAKIVTGTP